MAARRDFYDPITGRWISERTLLDRVSRYDVRRDELRDRAQAQIDRALARGRDIPRSARALLAEADQYDAALDAFDTQTELRAPPPRRAPARRVVESPGAMLPPALRGYYATAVRLVDAWGFDLDEAVGEWELGDDYEPSPRGR